MKGSKYPFTGGVTLSLFYLQDYWQTAPPGVSTLAALGSLSALLDTVLRMGLTWKAGMLVGAQYPHIFLGAPSLQNRLHSEVNKASRL